MHWHTATHACDDIYRMLSETRIKKKRFWVNLASFAPPNHDQMTRFNCDGPLFSIVAYLISPHSLNFLILISTGESALTVALKKERIIKKGNLGKPKSVAYFFKRLLFLLLDETKYCTPALPLLLLLLLLLFWSLNLFHSRLHIQARNPTNSQNTRPWLCACSITLTDRTILQCAFFLFGLWSAQTSLQTHRLDLYVTIL